MNIDWEKVIEAIPAKTGVYVMKDASGKAIYIGKAVNLRARVRSYFRETGDNRPSIQFLRNRLADIEFILTDSEKEALILENNLIKQLRPKYNIRFRDDKDYLCARLTTGEKFPRLITLRRPKPGSEPTFGPYSSAMELHETIRLLRKAFPLRTCSPTVFRNRARPCLNYQMGKCLGPCSNPVDEKEYNAMIEAIRMILSGKGAALIAELQDKMRRASEELSFENAAMYRDQIQAVEATIERQKMFRAGKGVGQDIIGTARKGDRVTASRMKVREGKVVCVDNFHFNAHGRDDEDIMDEFLRRLYGNDEDIPPEILVPVESESFAIITEWLSDRAGTRVNIRTPKRGEGLAMIELAGKNAEEAAESRIRREFDPDAVLNQLAQALGLRSSPHRIEGMDISNISGKLAVGSLVVFTDAVPDKSRYRRYRIRNTDEPNDYEMMREIISRRIKRGVEEKDLPDLILIDGGKGQLNIASKVLRELAAPKISLAAIAKDRRRRGMDRIFVPGRKNHVPMPQQALHLLQRVRDEAHRFAVHYHRNLRSGEGVGSELTRIPGIGPKKRNALLKHFGSLKRIKEASLEDLSKVKGITSMDVEKIYGSYHTKPEPGSIS